MNLVTKNQSEIEAFVQITNDPIAGGYTDSAAVDGTNQVIKTRSVDSGRTEYIITTNADSYENLDPTTLDLSAWPRVKRVASPVADSGDVAFIKNHVRTRSSFWIADNGLSYDIIVGEGILEGSKLSFFHNLVFGAASVPGKDGFAFRTITDATPVAVTGGNVPTLQRNPNFWSATWDWTGCPIKNSHYNGPKYGGVMITERHLLEAWHVPCPVGTVWTFMDSSGNLYTRYSIGTNVRLQSGESVEVEEHNSLPGDMSVHVLDSPLPAGIAHYPVVGPWACEITNTGATTPSRPWEKTGVVASVPLVGMFLDQTRFARFFGCYRGDCLVEGSSLTDVTYQGDNYSVPFVSLIMQSAWPDTGLNTLVSANTYYRIGISGDSGSPVFTPLDGSTMALMFCFAGPVSGPYLEEGRINALIASADANAGVSTGLTVTVAPDPTL